MTRGAVIIGFLFMVISGFSQKEDYTWVFGQGTLTTMAFQSDSSSLMDSIETNPFHRFFRTNANISDADGELQLYFTGQAVYNNHGDIIGNGDSINPGFFSDNTSGNASAVGQGGLLLSDLLDSTKIRLFHVKGDTIKLLPSNLGVGKEFLYSDIIEIGDSFYIEQKNVLIDSDTFTLSGIAACRQGNGRDWWLVLTGASNNCYKVYSYNMKSVTLSHEQCVGNKGNLNEGVQNVFSMDGKKFVRGGGETGPIVFDFDRCSGMLSNPIHFSDSLYNTSLANRMEGRVSFSPNGRFFYYATTSYLYQYDLEATDVIGSEIVIHQNPGPPFTYNFLDQRLAPNGKIYIASNGGFGNWNVIHNPDLLGAACNLEVAIPLPNPGSEGLPNFPNYRLGRLIGSPCDTLYQDTIMDTTDVIHELEINKALKMYPNPTSNVVRIEYGNFQWHSTDALSVSIFNTLGQLLLEESLPNYSLFQDYNVSQWDSGLYWVSLYNNGVFVGVRKLVVE